MNPELPTINPAGRYTVTQAAAILGVHRCTIDRWVKQGVMRASASNKVRRYFKGIDLMRAYNTH